MLVGARRSLLNPVFRNPLSLGSKLRAWWDYTDTSNLWQDTSATTPATANSDPVGRVSDKSGNGKHFLQSSSTLRPLYSSSGYVQFDGTDDYLSIAAAAFPIDDFELFHVVEQHAVATASNGLYTFAPSSGNDYASTAALIVSIADGTSRIQMYSNSGSLQVDETGTGNLPKALYETSKTATVATINKNGVFVASDSSFTALSSTHSGAFLDGARFTGSISTYGPIRRWETVMTAALTSDQRTALRNYLMSRHGL